MQDQHCRASNKKFPCEILSPIEQFSLYCEVAHYHTKAQWIFPVQILVADFDAVIEKLVPRYQKWVKSVVTIFSNSINV